MVDRLDDVPFSVPNIFDSWIVSDLLCNPRQAVTTYFYLFKWRMFVA